MPEISLCTTRRECYNGTNEVKIEDEDNEQVPLTRYSLLPLLSMRLKLIGEAVSYTLIS